jgi:histidine phosphotransferase ChpT
MTDTSSRLGAAWAQRFGAESATPAEPVSAADLASQLSARLCHDFVSPASAIVSGLDLLEDPTAADMREDAMRLIEGSARKLVSLLAFSRVAFGSSVSAESFDTRELEKLARGVFEHIRPELVWQVAPPALSKAPARALLNLAQIGGAALPTGGVATVTASIQGEDVLMAVEAVGTRARVRPEVASGLKGDKLEGGLGGHWVQAYFLHQLLKSAGGAVDHTASDDRVVLRARAPA